MDKKLTKTTYLDCVEYKRKNKRIYVYKKKDGENGEDCLLVMFKRLVTLDKEQLDLAMIREGEDKIKRIDDNTAILYGEIMITPEALSLMYDSLGDWAQIKHV